MKLLGLFFLCWSFSICSIAETFIANGTVHSIHDNADDLFGEDADFITLHNVIELGSCPKYNGLVVLRLPAWAKRSFSMALAAKMANKEVVVSIDDTRKDSTGACIIRWLRISD